MGLSNHTFDFDDVHPIDIVEDIAATQEWEFDRTEENQISVSVVGQWRSY